MEPLRKHLCLDIDCLPEHGRAACEEGTKGTHAETAKDQETQGMPRLCKIRAGSVRRTFLGAEEGWMQNGVEGPSSSATR